MIIKRVVQGMVWGLALLSVGTYAWIVIQRLAYPLELDCIEGVMMDHVVRISRGQPVFVEPTLRFIPLAYMPLFATVSAAITHFFEPAFWQARLVSALASFGLIALIIGIIRAETRSLTFAMAGAGVYALAFGYTGSCYDVARPDSLMLLLAFAGLATLRFTSGARGAVVAGLLMSLGFFAKQHAMLFVGAGALGLLVSDRRRLVPFALTVLVACAGGYFALAAWLGPWFSYFTWDVPRGWSEVDRARVQIYVGLGVIGTMAAYSIPSVLALGSPERSWRSPAGIWWFAGLGAFGTGLLGTLDPSAYKHIFMPTVVALAVLGPISLHRLATALDESAPAFARGRMSIAAAGFVAALQFMPLLYPVHSQLPHDRSVEAHDRLIEVLRAYPGEWLLPFHGFYESQSGKGTSLDIIAFDDIHRSRGNALLKRDPKYLARMLDSLTTGPLHFGIVSDTRLSEVGGYWARIAPSYVLVDSLGWITEPLRPLTGNRFAPRYVYLPSRDTTGIEPLRAALRTIGE